MKIYNLYLFRVVFYLRGKRYRSRFRLLRKWAGLRQKIDIFKEGNVRRFWIGRLLLVVMIDEDDRT